MTAKLRTPNRTQIALRPESLEQLLPPDHPARGVWDFVLTLDLTPWTDAVRSRKGGSGAPALDPRVLAALWLLAVLDGVASARRLARLCEVHLAYRWVCGDDPVNHHSLSDFRASDPAALDKLLAQSAAALMHAGVADLTRVAQDGVRVRANAGAASFRTGKTLAACLDEAEEQVRAVAAGDGGTGGGSKDAAAAAKERAAADRKARIAAAVENLDELRRANAAKRGSKPVPPEALRASTTDPEARRMTMADGGFRPAFNAPFATTVTGGVVVGVAVTNAGSDINRMEPMLEKIEGAYKTRPASHLVDGGSASPAAIGRAEAAGTRVVCPVPRAKAILARGGDPFAAKRRESAGAAAWRRRMGTDAATAEYKFRAATAEWVNALARARGLQRFLVRGLEKAHAVCVWLALAHNLTRGPGWTAAPV